MIVVRGWGKVREEERFRDQPGQKTPHEKYSKRQRETGRRRSMQAEGDLDPIMLTGAPGGMKVWLERMAPSNARIPL